MKLWKLPGQVVQLGILFIVGIIVVLLLRERFVPESFGELGHYRADAVDVVASQEIKYAGWQACAMCHPGEVAKKNNSYHRTVACETCHEAANGHTQDPASNRPVLPTKREDCLFCHAYLPSRPTGFPQIIETLHNPVKACVTCHDPHDPTPPERPGECSACHAAIARVKSVSHHAPLPCETCHDAPPEHRDAPRSHLPRKPTQRDFCGQCHAKDAKPEAAFSELDLGAYAIPRIDLAEHGGTYLCWQCHYQHSPEAR